jgi:hypothetical protein
MQVPETPQSIEQLDLMKQLKGYADGVTTWSRDERPLGPHAKRACLNLYNSLVQVVDKIFAILLDRVTAREMDTYTMHDRVHGLKVAHLMWHILEPRTRQNLTPAEIALLVCSAHLHDLGMGLSREERDARLDPASDLWLRLELDDAVRFAIDELRAQIGDQNLSETQRRRATVRLFQAEEALLTQDTRARHATYQRYTGMLDELSRMHEKDPERIHNIKASLSFDVDSFREKLIDICVSHNEDAEALVEADRQHSGRPRLPKDYPIGCCEADLHMVAATLRLADILDFDRERTPPALFHYLLPGPLAEPENDSGREWGKHLAISNWHIEEDAIVFRGRCRSHVIHHAIVLFASAIEREISNTRSTFGALKEVSWPCKLPTTVKVDIHEEGYRYVPYKFELDDDRVYSLLMGGSIYQDPMVAVRELVQNAVDACRLRDALTCLFEPQAQPLKANRILIRYEEFGNPLKLPLLMVEDTGTGMDALILERYFLKVGRSYYNSAEFNQTRVDLRKADLDFAPVSEFGIGFLSSFLLASRVEVETAMSESPRGDAAKRTLQIDGPTRLIRLSEQRNEGAQRFKGTRVTLHLSAGGRDNKNRPPHWDQIKDYLERICVDLPYTLNLEHVNNGKAMRTMIETEALSIDVPPYLEPLALRIPVDDQASGLEGEIVLINPYEGERAEKELTQTASASIVGNRKETPRGHHYETHSSLIRGGFRISSVPGLPGSFLIQTAALAKLRLTWQGRRDYRYTKTNLARDSAADEGQIAQQVLREWLSYLLDHIDDLPEGQLFHLSIPPLAWKGLSWLEKYDAFTLYKLAAKGWQLMLRNWRESQEVISDWEEGKGTPLRLLGFSDELHWLILDLVLPRVSSLQMASEARFFLTPPTVSWKTILSDCWTYISAPVTWGPFIEFISTIDHLLYYQYTGADYMNSRYMERLSSFHETEFPLLIKSLDKLTASLGRKRQARLSGDQAALIRRLQKTAGDLEIGSIHGSWRLDSLTIPESS